MFPGEDINLTETVRNATTSISLLSFSTLGTSHAGEYTYRGREFYYIAAAEVIAASSPVDVMVRCLMLNIILTAMCEEHPMKSL